MQRLKESAVVGGEFISEHLLAELGPTTRLRDLKASRIAAYRERRLAAGSVRRKDKTGRPSRLSAASINRPLALLRHLLRLAHEEGRCCRLSRRSGLRRSRRAASGGSNPTRSAA
jgi:hypothetical protein